jgi:hypothetical protein
MLSFAVGFTHYVKLYSELLTPVFTSCVKTKILLTNSGIYAGDGNDNTKWTLVQRIDIKG